jgi:alpha-tubulin suppressor-like RCC1 family protein
MRKPMSFAMQRMVRALTTALALATGITCGKDSTAPDPVATKLAIETALANVVAGVPITLQIRLTDDAGATVTSAAGSVSVAIASGTGVAGATLSGTLTATAASGIVTFTGLSIDKAGSGYQLTISATGLTSATSPAFTVAPGAAAKLVILVQPSNVTAGAAIAPGVQVAVQDALSNTVTNSTASITVAITSGTGTAGATLGGTAAVAAASGIATFSTLTIDKAASGYTLTASATGLTSATSSAVTVAPGAAAKLAASSPPATVVAGTAISPTLQVTVQDAFSNTVTSATTNVTVAITSGTGASGATLGGTATVAAANGIATFSTLTIDKAASGYTLSASATGLTSATTSAITVSPGVATKLAASVQPTNTVAGASISPSVQFVVQDALGNTVTTATNSVTVAISAGTGAVGAVLGGTTTVAATAGVASFSGLTLDKAASGYTLSATATALTAAVTSAFTISVGAASKLGFTVNASNAVAAVAIAPSIQVAVQDAQGNTVTTATNSITLAIATDPSGVTAVLSGTKTVAAVAGIAAFSGLSINKAATGFVLSAAATGLTTANGTAFNITAGAATQIQRVSAGHGQSAVVGTKVTIAPSVTVYDANFNTVAGASVTFAVTAGGGSLDALVATSNAAGIATPGNWTLGPAAGQNEFTAILTGPIGTAVTFAATAHGGAATQIAVNAGNNETAAVGETIQTSPSVIVRDANGVPVGAGTQVVWALASGTGHSITEATGVTSTGGIATVGSWTLGTAAGVYTITATATGLTGSPVTFTATATAGNATQIAINTGNNQDAVAGSAVGIAPTVIVKDVYNNPKGDVTVTFAVASGGGSRTNATAQTNASGIATVGAWTLGTTAGANTLTATVSGLTGSPLTFTANGIPGTASSLVFNAGSVLSFVSASVTTPPSVKVVDANNNGVSGVSVTFAVTGGGGSISGDAIKTTNSSGIATLTGWQMGGTEVVNTLTATSGSLTGSPVTFSADFFRRVAVGTDATCGVTWGGKMYCFGSDAEGLLGNGSGSSATQTSPVLVSGGLTFATAAGSITMNKLVCALTSAGAAYCWGLDSFGAAGHGGAVGSTLTSPTAVTGSHTFSTISTGAQHTCGVTTGGAGYCWGTGADGQIGDGAGTQRLSPTLVSGSHTFAYIGAGTAHSCGLTTAGAVYCWGSNASGQLGTGSATPAFESAPVAVTGGHVFTSLSVGANHSCGITNTSTVLCWGSGSNGQIGRNSTANELSPIVAFLGAHTGTSVIAGGNSTCATFASGLPSCWGAHSDGQLGTGGVNTNVLTPASMPGDPVMTKLAIGSTRSCGLRDDSRFYCWGKNDIGQNGDGTTTTTNTPIVVILP